MAARVSHLCMEFVYWDLGLYAVSVYASCSLWQCIVAGWCIKEKVCVCVCSRDRRAPHLLCHPSKCCLAQMWLVAIVWYSVLVHKTVLMCCHFVVGCGIVTWRLSDKMKPRAIYIKIVCNGVWYQSVWLNAMISASFSAMISVSFSA